MGTVERRIAATCETVFDVLSDGWLFSSWVVGTARIRDVDATWPAVGSQLHHSFGVWPLLLDDESEVLVSERPHRLVLEARGWPAGEATVDITLAPDGDGCRVRMTEKATSGPGTLVPTPMEDVLMKVRNREALLRLSLIAENRVA